MSTEPRPPESPDLDFTPAIVARMPEARNEADDIIAPMLRQSDALIDALKLEIALGCRDAKVWKLLAAVLVGTDRISDYDDLAKKHMAVFGAPIKLDLPAVTFTLPEKINQDSKTSR